MNRQEHLKLIIEEGENLCDELEKLSFLCTDLQNMIHQHVEDYGMEDCRNYSLDALHQVLEDLKNFDLEDFVPYKE